MGNYIDELKQGKYNDTNYYDYWSQCRRLNYAAEECFLHFSQKATTPPSTTENYFKLSGLFNASLLLRAVAIENLIKARVLFMMKENGTLSNYTSINDIIKKEWGRASHNPIKLCEKYQIELDFKARALIENHLDHMDWAGRFPYPKNNNNIKSEHSLGGTQKDDMNKLILRFTNEMNLKLEEIKQ